VGERAGGVAVAERRVDEKSSHPDHIGCRCSNHPPATRAASSSSDKGSSARWVKGRQENLRDSPDECDSDCQSSGLP
jgi:hypothetical protein